MILLICYIILFSIYLVIGISAFLAMKIQDEPNSKVGQVFKALCDGTKIIFIGLFKRRSIIYSIAALGLVLVPIITLYRIITLEYKNIEDVVIIAIFSGVFFVLERLNKANQFLRAILVVIIMGVVYLAWSEPIHKPDSSPIVLRDIIMNILLYIFFVAGCFSGIKTCIAYIKDTLINIK